MSNEQMKCRVPMWMVGCPAGYCSKAAFGEQLPREILLHDRRFWSQSDIPYCFGPCCPDHGGPKEDEVRIYADGTSESGHRMWCAVLPDFENLQESPAAFSVNPLQARTELKKMASDQ